VNTIQVILDQILDYLLLEEIIFWPILVTLESNSELFRGSLSLRIKGLTLKKKIKIKF
jgi:hypothetical protein